MCSLRFPLYGLAVLLSAGSVLAQQQPSAAGNAIRNGGFEQATADANLWDGVNRDGFLAGFRDYLVVLDDKGNINKAPMPVSVAVGDLNGDGLADIVSADSLGYIRVYFNSGTKEEPKFTTGELTLPFLALPDGDPPWRPPELSDREGNELGQWNMRWARRRQGVRVSLADISNTGKLDIVAGNYFGEIFIIPNRGTATAPKFEQPQPFLRGITPTTKDPNHRWGNVFSPLMTDWDGDGKADLLIGEGSYSANNVHLFINQGNAVSPTFNEGKRQPLALGQGRQQLSPTLVDVNGDGKLDILVADRGGRLTVYLRPANWKFGDTIAPSGFISRAGGVTEHEGESLTIGAGINTIAAGDLTGDGLFDLVMGDNEGRILWMKNRGSKESPTFDQPNQIQGTPPSPLSWDRPSSWDIDTGVVRGNFLSYATVVSNNDDANAQAPEGGHALKFGYSPWAGKVMMRPLLQVPATRMFDPKGALGGIDAIYRGSAELRSLGAANNYFVMRQNVKMKIGKTYNLTFSAKGAGVNVGTILLGWRGYKKLGEERQIRGDRGAVRKEKNELNEEIQEFTTFQPSNMWGTISKQFKIAFKKNRELNKEEFTSEAILEIAFELNAPDGYLYLDDIRLSPMEE